MSHSPTWRIRVYEFLAAPAHAWLMICAAILGLRLKFGPINSIRIEN